MIIESPLELIFRDLFYRLGAFAGDSDVFLNLEGFNITGSIKVKTAIRLIEEFEQVGIMKPHESLIVESSSGNLGLALSLVCAIKGYKFICVTDPTANRATIRGMKLYGANVIIVEERDSGGGYLESRLKKSSKYYNRTRTRSGSINMLTWPTRMLTPNKRRLRSRANSTWSIGFLSGQALLAPSPGSQRDFVKNIQGSRLLPSSRRALSHLGCAREKKYPGHWHKHETKARGSRHAG